MAHVHDAPAKPPEFKLIPDNETLEVTMDPLSKDDASNLERWAISHGYQVAHGGERYRIVERYAERYCFRKTS